MKHKTIKQLGIWALVCVFLIQSISPVTTFAQTANNTIETAQDKIPEDAIFITTAEEFITLLGSSSGEEATYGKTFVLKNDIDLSGSNFTPIPVFAGTLEGNGHAVKGLLLEEEGTDIGLFRFIGEHGVVSNLIVEGTVIPHGSMTTIGGIAGTNKGTIISCTFKGTMVASKDLGGIAGVNEESGVILQCTNEASILGTKRAGGIAGSNKGTVSLCTNKGAVNATEQSVPTDDSEMTSTQLDLSTMIEDENKVESIGGIAGISSGKLLKCQNEGTIGYQHIGYQVGGIVGYQNGYIEECTNKGFVYGRKDVAGIAGLFEPYLELSYKEDTIDELENQMDTLENMFDSLSDISSNAGDLFEADTDRISEKSQQLQDTISEYKEYYRDKGDSFDSEMSNRMDDISDQIDDLDFSINLSSMKDNLDALIKEVDNLSNYVKLLAEQGVNQAAEYQGYIEQAQDIINQAGQYIDNAQQVEDIDADEGVDDELNASAGDTTDDGTADDENTGDGDSNSSGDSNTGDGDTSTGDSTTDGNTSNDDSSSSGGSSSGGDSSSGGSSSGGDSSSGGSSSDGDSSSGGDSSDGAENTAYNPFHRSSQEQARIITLTTNSNDPQLIFVDNTSDENTDDNSGDSSDTNDDASNEDAGNGEENTNTGNNSSENIAGITQEIQDAINQTQSKVDSSVSNIADITKDMSKSVSKQVKKSKDFKEDLDDLWDSSKDLLDYVGDQKDSWKSDLQDSSDTVGNQIDEVKDAFDTTKDNLKASKNQIKDQLDAIKDQMKSIKSTVKDGIQRVQDRLESGEFYYDVSDRADRTVGNGKIIGCSNQAEINGDIDGGGIVGRIALEVTNTVSHSIGEQFEITESGNQSFNVSQNVLAAVYDCINTSDVFVKNTYAGGIVGRADYGAAISCENYGNITIDSGNYAGGIVGKSNNLVRDSYSLCDVEADDYVGGIVGFGKDVDQNVAMATAISIKGGRAGTIAGDIDSTGEVTDNQFVEEGQGAVNNVTYLQHASALTYKQLLQDDAVPDGFKVFHIRYMADNVIVKNMKASYGDTISLDMIPEIPQKDGTFAAWEDKDITSIARNLTIHAEYEPWENSIATKETVGQRAVMIAAADFFPNTEITCTEIPASEVLDDEIPFGYSFVKAYQYQITTPYEKQWNQIQLRLLVEDINNNLTVAMLTEQGYQVIDSRVVGSYVEFYGDDSGKFIVLERAVSNQTQTIFIVIGVALVAVLLIVIVKRKKKKTK